MREVVHRRRVTILVYHRLQPDVADQHFSALRNFYTPISLQTYLEARNANRFDRLPVKAVIVTIDDGHKSIIRLKHILAKHQMPVTVFLCSGLVGTNRRFWFSAPGLDDNMRQFLKAVPDDGRLSALAAIGFEQSDEFEERESLDEAEVRELLDLIDFQSHSVSHAILPACSDKKATEEIASSKRQLETRLGLQVNALAYPNGNYGAREMTLASEAGYSCGLTMNAGVNGPDTPLFALRRLPIRDDCGVHELLVRSSCLWALLTAWKRLTRGIVSSSVRNRPKLDVRSSAQRVPQ